MRLLHMALCLTLPLAITATPTWAAGKPLLTAAECEELKSPAAFDGAWARWQKADAENAIQSDADRLVVIIAYQSVLENAIKKYNQTLENLDQAEELIGAGMDPKQRANLKTILSRTRQTILAEVAELKERSEGAKSNVLKIWNDLCTNEDDDEPVTATNTTTTEPMVPSAPPAVMMVPPSTTPPPPALGPTAQSTTAAPFTDPGEAGLDLVDVVPDKSYDTWLVSAGLITQRLPNGTASTYRWTAPPSTIGPQGFSISLEVQTTAAANNRQEAGITASGSFDFDPAKHNVTVLSENKQTVHDSITLLAKPRVSSASASGIVEFHVGADYGPGVTYRYQTRHN